jgi:hypothetical protein
VLLERVTRSITIVGSDCLELLVVRAVSIVRVRGLGLSGSLMLTRY